MSNKLQELTDRLYNEGLSKGRQEADAIVENARKEADEMTKDAAAAAEEIIAKAKKEAQQIADKAAADVKMASAQALDATKARIEALVSAKVVEEGVQKALSDEEFSRQVIMAVAKNFSASNSSDLQMVLPQAMKEQIGSYVSTEVSKAIGKGIEVKYSASIKGGFTIGPADGSYFISMDETTFSALIKEYLRPYTRRILFGE